MHLGTPDELVTDLMQRDLVTVEATDDQEAVAAKVADYNFMAIPVVDHEHHLVGIITHDDVIDVLRKRPKKTRIALVTLRRWKKSYLNTPIHTLSWEAWDVAECVARGFVLWCLRSNHFMKRWTRSLG